MVVANAIENNINRGIDALPTSPDVVLQLSTMFEILQTCLLDSFVSKCEMHSSIMFEILPPFLHDLQNGFLLVHPARFRPSTGQEMSAFWRTSQHQVIHSVLHPLRLPGSTSHVTE